MITFAEHFFTYKFLIMESIIRIQRFLEEAAIDLKNLNATNPLDPRFSVNTKKEFTKTSRMLMECKSRLWLFNDLFEGRIDEKEFHEKLKNELDLIHFRKNEE
jgi:hypothetical protein